MNKTYRVMPGVGPYGARIFLHTDVVFSDVESDVAIISEVKKRCCWGGPDKIFGAWHGFEFASTDGSFGGCIAVLKEKGFREETGWSFD